MTEATESNDLIDALRRAHRVEAHVFDAISKKVGVTFSFYDEGEKDPFMKTTGTFDKDGVGSMDEQSGLP